MATNPAPASQPSATSALTAPLKLNSGALRSLGQTLQSRFVQYRNERRLAEIQWTKNERQFKGIYDPEIDAAIDKNRSRAYPKLTRVKCVSMLSRIMNMMFQASDKNWTVKASPMPDLTQEDLQTVLDGLMQQNPDVNTITADQINYAICEFAKKRAKNLEIQIEDQLSSMGGPTADGYERLCGKVLASGIKYGGGVLRGPFVDEQKQRSWQIADGKLVAIEKTVYAPVYEFIPVWDYYPDISARSLGQMDGQFIRRVMNRQHFMELKKRSDFFADQIEEVARTMPNGNYKREAYETELRAMGPQINTPQNMTGKYECIVWDGIIASVDLEKIGINVPEKYAQDAVLAQVWMVDGVVIKAEVNPWVTLVDDQRTIKQYHHFIFEEDESFILGNGLPNIMRDSQLGLSAATRIMLDNASVQRVFEVNTQVMVPGQDVTSIQPDMVVYRDDDSPATMNVPMIRPVTMPQVSAENQNLVNMFQSFADQETFVGPATGGDMQRGPSEPFRTAAGASMLRGDAALPFKDVVRNFDVFTESVIGSLILFNAKFNPSEDIRGDFTPVARGATSLMAKEVQGMQLDNLATTLTDEEKPYLNPRALLRARLSTRDIDPHDVVYDDTKCDQIDQQNAQKAQKLEEQAAQMTQAQVRKLLSDTLKNIAQANKNSAGAEAQIANVVLSALEKGLNPDMLAANPTGDQNGANNTAGEANAGVGQAGEQPAGPAESQLPGIGAAGAQAATGGPIDAAGQAPAAMPAG